MIVKIILSGLTSVLSLLATAKTQCFDHWSFNSTLQLINDNSSDLQKLLRYFNSTAMVAFYRISMFLFGVDLASVSLTI